MATIRARLALRDTMRDALAYPDERRWWWLVCWRWLAGPVFRVLVGLGAWDVPEGERYLAGRFRWDIWRANRPWGA